MSVSQNYPIIAPSLLLDFSSVQALDPRISYARASTATYYGTQTALAEQNLLLYSQQLDQSPWSGVDATATANTTTAPDGTSTADTITETANTSGHRYAPASFTTLALPYVFSVFLKKGTGATAPDWMQLVFTGLNSGYVNFNLSTGAVGASGFGGTGTITNAGGGWWRCTLSQASFSAGSTGLAIAFTNNNDGLGRLPSYAGATTSDVFAWGAQLEQRSAVSSYTPTTTQPVTNYIPVLETAASGVARFDHNPVTFESLGLLIEEQRTNLLTYSEQFDNAAWTKLELSIISNTIIAPDGTLTGDKLVESTATSNHIVRQGGTISAGATVTYSSFVKAGERTNCFVQLDDGTATNQIRVSFNLSTGAASSLTIVGAATNESATITSVGNGWYRITVTGTPSGSATTARAATQPQAVLGVNSYTGDGYSGIYIWGAQLEAGAFPTSYIPTVASQVTRAADSASMTGTNFSSWYTQGEGTLYVESLAQNTAAANNKNLRFSDGTTSNEIWLGSGSPGTSSRSQITLGGVNYFDSNMSNQVTAGQFGKYALAFETNNTVLCSNGTLGTVDTAVPIPSSINQLTIIPPSQRAGYYKKIAYYPVAVTSAQLQALTG